MINIPAGWEDTVNTAIYQASCAAMRMDPESDEACSFFRASWPNEGNPAPPVNQDVCYYRLYNRDDPTMNMTFREPTITGMKFTATVPIICQWVFYGPNATRYSSWLRTALYRRVVEKVYDVEYPAPMVILHQSNIVPDPFPAQPVHLPEPSTDGWRSRSDLTIQFNYTEQNDFISDGVETPPDIHVIKEEE
jgi:hypothetical protein